MRKYSICCPVNNVEKYLKEAIKSIINRTYKNIELILVDDCTKDDSFNIYIYKRIVIYKNNNNNLDVLGTEMKAISLSTGDYVLFLDDDYYERNAIEIIGNYINDSIDLAIYGSRKFNNKGTLYTLKYDNRIYNKNNRNSFLLRVATNNNYNLWW